MSVPQEDKTNTEGGQDGSPDASETATATNSGERIRVEDLVIFLSVTPSRGLQTPSLEGKRLCRGNVKTFLTDYQGYTSRMTEGVFGGIPKRSVGVYELVDEDQR